MELVEPIRDIRKIEKMKKYLKAKSLRDYCLFVLGINSGLRVSDLLNLKVGDVEDENGKLKDRIRLTEQKTGKHKDFPISDTAAKALREYLDSMNDRTTADFLFPSRKKRACEVLSVSYPRLPLLWQLILMWRRLFARRRHVSTIGYRPLSVNFSI